MEAAADDVRLHLSVNVWGNSGPYTSSCAYSADDLPVTVTLNSTHTGSQVQQVATYDPESRLTHLGASGAISDTYDYAYQNGTDWTPAMTWTVNGVVTATQIQHNAQGQRARYTVVSGTATLRDERFSYRGDDLG